MGSLPGLIGITPNTDSAAAGSRFNASGAPITSPVTQAQATDAYGRTQTGLDQQQAFLNALQAQNGIQNQSDVYAQMQGIANGTGPNPAQAALNQATSANVANQAALMAGQRGAGANAGLIARQAAMQGGALQQQAAGQGATMQAQQQLAAMNTAGNIAGQQVANQAGATAGYNQAAQSEQQNLLNSIQGVNNANVAMRSNQNSANSGVAAQNASSQNSLIGGVMNGASMAAMMAKGGEVTAMADGGMAMTGAPMQAAPMMPATGPSSFVGKFLYGSAPSQTSASGEAGTAANPMGMDQKSMVEKGGESTGKAMGGGLKGLFSSAAPTGAGQIAGGADAADLSSAAVMVAAKGGMAQKQPVTGPMLAAKGKEVPGKAKVKGDSLKNDVVPAILSPGEIVIPRHITQGKNAPAESAKFVAAILARKGRK